MEPKECPRCLTEMNPKDSGKAWGCICGFSATTDYIVGYWDAVALWTKKVDELSKMVWLTPKEKCQKHNIQCCYDCEDIECCDNTNPIVKELKELRAKN